MCEICFNDEKLHNYVSWYLIKLQQEHAEWPFVVKKEAPK